VGENLWLAYGHYNTENTGPATHGDEVWSFMLKRLFRSQLRINMASGVAATIINMAVLAVGYPIYLHFLGYEKYGVWLILATVLSVARLGDLGVNRAVMKLVAEEYGRGNMEALQEYVMTAIAILIAAGAAVLIVIVTFRAQIAGAFRLTGENAQMVLWLLPYIACLSIYVFIVQALNAVLSGLGRMDLANLTQSAGRILRVTTAGSLLYFGHGIESLLIGSALSYALIHIVSLVLIWRIAQIHFFRVRNLSRQRCRRLLSFGLTLCGGSLVNMLLSPFNKLMLSRYAGVSAIPIYEMAFNGSMHVRALIEAGLRPLMPEVSRLGANMTGYARDRISRIYRHAMKLIFFFGIPVYAAIVVLLTPLLKLWLRQRFVQELPGAFRIMLISTFVSLLSVPSYFILLGLGMVRHTLISHVILCGISSLIVLTIAIIRHRISVEAISWAILAATGVTSVYLIRESTRRVLK